ncbi:MAG TPA: sigma-70 family RNA polymerase sigma factor [Puia sp.]|uniref:RNA polymerase sigma factor n=1 Tax=Puia sp. TaxID=2045100 RepID=UPI002C5A56D0|nr:sigma-70 family RNA polymerase sigma factor [Puia sp.]HVU97927.1 sigma-70 family RNA polymerase sigma factor [Puia sp.]
MLQFSRELDLETAEDLVQDAFYSALSTWKHSGIPDNPAGWIYKVSRNNALNFLKRNKSFQNPFGEEQAIDEMAEPNEDPFDDRKMFLLFACAHPRLSSKMQVVITLKYVANIRGESLARALGMTTDGIDKVLLRAKSLIRMENLFRKELTAQQLKARLPAVHKIIYLVFNEGYRAGSGQEMIREDLCEESLIMTKSLLDNHICNAETAALYSLLLFNAARLGARLTTAGELLDLEEQDRALWDSDLIALGHYYFTRSQVPGEISSYHYEAAIAYIHSHAKSFADTDWGAIIQLYNKLLEGKPNPFISLNYAIALYYGGQKTLAFEVLEGLRKTFLEQYFLLHAALGKLYLLEGDLDKSDLYLNTALSLTSFQAEKDVVRKMLLKN